MFGTAPVRGFSQFGPAPGGIGAGDPVVWAGEGVADLDRLANWMRAYPGARWRIDVSLAGGYIGGYAKWEVLVLDDVLLLRSIYIETWGTVNRPPMSDPMDRRGFAHAMPPIVVVVD
jgi:hypothetical protein